MYFKVVKAFQAAGNDFGVKIFGTHQGADAIRACPVGTYCWLSVVGEANQGDAGHVVLSADGVSDEFELEVKQLGLEAFGREVEPVADPAKP